MPSTLHNKKVLLMGLGILGGGLNTAKWLLKQGALLTITDLKNEEKLAVPLAELKKHSQKIKLTLGKHEEKDFLENNIIVVNPDVPLTNPFLHFAIAHGKQIENELTLFYKYIAPDANIVAITGTRGKTTTANWTAHFLQSKFPKTHAIGNSPTNPLLKLSNTKQTKAPIVIETPSFMLEHSTRAGFAPRVAVITNIYQDHLNRYESFEHYVATKGDIFKDQKDTDTLVLNADNPWTTFFLSQKPKSHIRFFSVKTLSKNKEGVFIKSGMIWLREKTRELPIVSADMITKTWGAHNLSNFLASSLAAIACGVSPAQIKKQIRTLPQIPFRQELIAKKQNIEIYNDTTATSPEAGMAAFERFAKVKKRLFLITGGTDRNLEYKEWARTLKQNINKNHLVFLNGSATIKMKDALKWQDIQTFETLEECIAWALKQARAQKKPAIILFSPSAKSFEKFKNEYNRGAQFNALIKKSH